MTVKNLFKILLVVSAAVIAPAARGETLRKITFGTNWLAQGEHGGFYQALTDGTYKRYGLDVTIVPGGPRINQRLMLAMGRIDFYMGGSMLESFNAVQNGIPTIVVAAIFQKDPQMLMVHPDQGADKFEDLKNFTLHMSAPLQTSVFKWIETKYGFEAKNLRPYEFNMAPFCADKSSAQQGYVTSEPFTAQKICGLAPKVFLFADAGYDSYSTTIETQKSLVEKDTDLVRRFVDASLIGWYNYLYSDNSAANALIKRDNPDMTDERLANSLAKMKEYGIVDSGDALTHGIGAMTDTRQKSFFDKMVEVNYFPAELDYRQAYTLQFVNKRVGMDAAH